MCDSGQIMYPTENDVESDEFLRQGVYCKKWLGRSKWTEKCRDGRNPDNNTFDNVHGETEKHTWQNSNLLYRAYTQHHYIGNVDHYV